MAELPKAGLVKAGVDKAGLHEQVIAGVTELLPVFRQRTQEAEDIQAVDLLFENSGRRALKMGTPIQRFWRDAHAGRVHAINDPERAGRRRHLDQPGDHRGQPVGA